MVEKNSIVYFERCVPTCDIYDTLQLSIRSVGDNWFVGVDTTTRQAYPFDRDNIGVLIFSNKKEADEVVETLKKKYGVRKLTKVREEEEDDG